MGQNWTQDSEAMDTLLIQLRREEDLQFEMEQSTRREARSARQDAQVVNGAHQDWQPIDRQAAMMLAKAPYLSQPPPPLLSPNTKRKPMKPLDINKHPGLLERAVGNEEAMKNAKGVDKDTIPCVDINKLAEAVVDHIRATLPSNETELAVAVRDARKVLDDNIQNVNLVMQEYDRVMAEALTTVRTKRMATVAEAAATVTALKEVRSFFLGKDYKEEIGRLNEFIDVCERLKKLKDSGFLDTVADTMIRLSA